MRLDGKVVLISGAASGMGASHARAVIREGARVVVGDVADQAGATLVAELGDAARFVHLDVRRDEDWAAAVDTAVREFGRLDALVNNAGILRGAGVIDCTDEDWDLVLAINLTGAFRGIRACVAALEASGAGSVVNISSTAGIKGFADNIAYGTRLSALLGGAHFVVDTSRNGNGPAQKGAGDRHWCNPAGRALGDPPTMRTGVPLVDAYLWVKRPGESDGACGSGAPAAGQWWPGYALKLAR